MNTTLKKWAIALLSIVAVLFTSCVDDDDNGNIIPGNNSILDRTVANSDLSILETALIRTGLNDTFGNPGDYTFFAPNDAAFDLYLTNNAFTSIEAIPITDLRALLLYHALNTKVTLELISNGYVKTLGKDEEVESLDLFIEAATPVLLNGTAGVIDADIEVDNGVMHIIDRVLELPTITTLIAANPDFDDLQTALELTNLDGLLSSEVGTMQAPFTFFAPNNEGFQNLINLNPADGFNVVQDILDISNLDEVLSYHIVGNDRIRSGDISNGLMISPLFGGNYLINTTSGIQFVDGTMTTATITPANITAINGIIHTLDIVIRPM
ncbi:MAG: putative surface protein with fasciclin (FAS1) repeats [Nonlabens sp.]|jgi:uncharacterized surface protein with fasciclin (FAS1) repeats|uniref:fasciclin domain-containing protein n=1 Tax=Nonlabens sp. TaxID=1888209 RepID=UPI0039E706A3